MRALKIGAIAAVAMLLVMLLMLGYLFMSAEITVSVTGAQSSPAATDNRFMEHRTAIDEQTFIGTVYNKPDHWKDASQYAYVTYTVHVKNGCLVPIETIEVQVVPMPTDVAQLTTWQEAALPANSEGDLTATILTHATGTPIREMIVTYYVWGVSFQVRTMAGE